MIAKLIHPWFEAKFYGNVYQDRLCDDSECRRPKPHTHSGFHHQGNQLERAQGLELWCPCGFGKAEFVKGRPHGILIPFSNPINAPAPPSNHGPVGRDGKTHPRWVVSGTSLEDLTLSPSVEVNPKRPCWHGHIQNGEVR